MQAMLPKLALTEQLAPLLAPQKAAERVAAAATASEIKRMVDELPMLLSNRSKGLQGEISRHQAEVKQERYVKSMPMGTAEQKAPKRAFVSGASKEEGGCVARLMPIPPESPYRRRVSGKLRAAAGSECECTAAATSAVPGLHDAADRPDSTCPALW